MRSHQEIDERSLRLARAVAQRVDRKPELLKQVREWAENQDSQAVREWLPILCRPWEQIRPVLLSSCQESARLRQSSPFVGVLTPQERWAIYAEKTS